MTFALQPPLWPPQPKKFTNDMLVAAFVAHIKVIADRDHPLVVYQGLPLRYLVFPGQSIINS